MGRAKVYSGFKVVEQRDFTMHFLGVHGIIMGRDMNFGGWFLWLVLKVFFLCCGCFFVCFFFFLKH